MSSTSGSRLLFILLSALLSLPQIAASPKEQQARFYPLDVFVDVAQPLAAYQLELVVESGQAQIVGVEGGEHQAFRDAPYYDPKALMGGRIILAAYSTESDLPIGRSRLLTVHMREQGQGAQYTLRLVVVVDEQGQSLDVNATLEPREVTGE